MTKRSEPKTKPETRPKRKPKGSGLAIAGVPRVNLLPASEVQRRAAGVLVRRWAAGLVATAMVVSGLVAVAHWERTVATQQLAAEQARTLDLNGKLADLSHVSRTFAERTALTTLRGQAMSTDTQWRPLFADLTGALPKGAELAGFDLVTGINPVAELDPGSQIGLIGRLTVNTNDPADQNRVVDKLRSLDMTLAADAGPLSSEGEDGFSFVVEFVLNQTHYSGDHLPETGAR